VKRHGWRVYPRVPEGRGAAGERGFAALGYLELCYARHQLAAILRSPPRLAIWVPYVFLIGFFVYSRLLRHHSAYVSFALEPVLATTIGGLYLAMLGATIGFAAAGRVALFRSSAEAVMFSNAGLRPLTIAIWLQLRKLGTSWTRWLGGFIYLFAIAAPHDPRPSTVLRAFIAAALALAIQMTVELPVFLLSRGDLREPLIVGGWTLAAIGAAYAVAGFFGPHAADLLANLTHFDPGAGVATLLRGSTIGTILLAIVVCGLVASIAFLGNDALPELYAASQQALANQRRRSKPGQPHFVATPSDVSRIPGGALALVWKDWIGFRRGRGAFRLWLIGCTFWAVCGAAAALGAMRWSDPTPLYTLGALTCLMVLVIAPYGASAGLSGDLTKPLFWLSSASLRKRLAAWTFGRAWRGGLAFGLAPLVAGLSTGDAALALISLPLAITAYWSLQALGVGLYAVFPNPIDTRGPIMMLRLVLTLLFVFPAALVAALAAFAGSGPYVATLGFVLQLGIESWLVIEFATHRFREFGATLGTISRAS